MLTSTLNHTNLHKKILKLVATNRQDALRQLIRLTTDGENINHLHMFFEELDVHHLTDESVFLIANLWPFLPKGSKLRLIEALIDKSVIHEILPKIDRVNEKFSLYFFKYSMNSYTQYCLAVGDIGHLADFLTDYWDTLNEDNKERVVNNLIYMNFYTNEFLLHLSRSEKSLGILFDFFDIATTQRKEIKAVSNFIISLYPQLNDNSYQFSLWLLIWNSYLQGNELIKNVVSNLSSLPNFNLHLSQIALAALEMVNIDILRLLIQSHLNFPTDLYHLELLSEEQFLLITKLIDAELTTDKAQAISRYIPQFSEEFGKVTFNGALLTCSQLKSRKSYHFDCTVIDLTEEYAAYSNGIVAGIKCFFATLKESNTPLREKFIFCDFHWHSGEIIIDENLNAYLFLIDSLGADSLYLPCEIEETFFSIFPNGNFYLSKEKRQFSEKGCSAMALDDCIHLFSIENYLDKKYKKTGLLGYLKDVAQPSKKSPNIKIVPLPIPFLRTTQSSAIFRYLSKMEEGVIQSLINKSNMNIYDSLQADFISTEGGKKINMRLKHKLNKTACYNRHYLFSHPDLNRLEDDFKLFTLDGLKERCKSTK